jgi:hypothetical protein
MLMTSRRRHVVERRSFGNWEIVALEWTRGDPWVLKTPPGTADSTMPVDVKDGLLRRRPLMMRSAGTVGAAVMGGGGEEGGEAVGR